MAYSVSAASQILREAMQTLFRRYSLWYLVQGCVLVLVGAFAVVSPLIASLAAIGVLGWLLIMAGVLQTIGLIGARATQSFPLHVLSAVLFVLVGVLFLRNPADSLLAVAMLLMVLMMVQGIARIMFALNIRPIDEWQWLLVAGVAEIALAVVLWTNMPVTALWLVGLVLGAGLICEGGAMAWLAWNLRRAGKDAQEVPESNLPKVDA